MARTDVFFTDRKTESSYNMLDKLEHVFTELGLDKVIQSGNKVMIKTHMGLHGNTNHLRPVYVSKLVDLVKSAGGIPFVSDTCSLGYGNARPYGGRTTAPEYLARAIKNGFSQGTLGAPIVIADGYWGCDTHNVSIDGKHIKSVPIPAALLDCDVVLVLTHSKFHHTGLASTLKNLGVGLVGKGGKLAVHCPTGIEIEADKCLGSDCSKCIDVCPTRCITITDTVSIDWDHCKQCGHCASICSGVVKAGAIKMTWSGKDMGERIVENALGVVNSIGSEKFYYFNLAIDISDMCDCVCYGAPLLMHDVGIFGSTDPVAIDHATREAMTEMHPNRDSPAVEKLNELLTKSDVFFDHGVSIGLGTKDYELKLLKR